MAENKPATVEALGELHSLVARVLTKQLSLADAALTGELTPEQIEALENVLSDTKVSLGAAITFLKNNNVTADASRSAELRELTDALAERRNRGKTALNDADLRAAAAAFDNMTGGMQ